MKDFSAVANAHPQYIDSLFQSWQADPESVSADWAAFFKGFDYALTSSGGQVSGAASVGNWGKEFGVLGLIHGYRDRGHLESTTNPIRARKDRKACLQLADYGLSEADLDTSFAAGSEINMPGATLRQIIGRLKELYVGNIGFESAHIHDKERRTWLRERVESREIKPGFYNMWDSL